VQGSWSAQGGRLSGDGGFIETSASHLSVGEGVIVNTLAVRGKSGQWLLDPNDFTIAAGGDVTGATLTAALATGDVEITTTIGNATCTGVACGAGSAGNGDINVNDSVTIGAGRRLTLNAYRNINLNSQITVNADPATRLYLWFGMQGSGEAGAVVVNAGGGTTAPLGNIRGGNFATHAIPSYPVLDNFSYTAPAPTPAPAPAPAPVDTNAYVRLDEGQSSTYGDLPNPNPLYALYTTSNGGSRLSITPASGAISWNTPITAKTNAGIYDLAYRGNFTLTGYSIRAGDAVSWTVKPKPVAVTFAKTYDGYTLFVPNKDSITGLIKGDDLQIFFVVDSPNAGTYKSFVDTRYMNSNYTLSNVSATILPKPVSATATKTYDGSTYFAPGSFMFSGVLASDRIDLVHPTYTSSANAGTYNSFSNVALANSNYTFTGGTLSATITPKPLDIAVTKLYDTTPTFLKDFKITGTVGNESAPTVTGGSATVSAADADTYSAFTANSLTSSNPNYTLQGGKVSASIAKARLDPGFVWLMAILNYKNVQEVWNKNLDEKFESCDSGTEGLGCHTLLSVGKWLLVSALGAGDGATSAAWIRKFNNGNLVLLWKDVLQTQLDAAGLSKGFEVNDDDIRAWLKGLTAK
jgi:hypothetical protein